MVGVRTPVALAAFLLVVVPVNASLLQDGTNGVVTYQFDAETTTDAPDACAGATPAWSVPLGSSTDGVLVPPDDFTDAFVLDVPASAVGSRLTVALVQEHTGPELSFNTFAPGCLGDVFDALNQPKAHPAPPAPAEGETQHPVESNSSARRCDNSGWTFSVSGLQDMTPPPEVHVAWTDGTQGKAPLTGSAEGVAIYETSQVLQYTIEGAWINLPAGWDGHFPIVKGPCDAVDGGAVYGEPATVGDGTLSFTPIRAGPHVVQVDVRSLAPQEPDTPQAPTPATVGQRSCHHCVSGIEDLLHPITYNLFASSQ